MYIDLSDLSFVKEYVDRLLLLLRLDVLIHHVGVILSERSVTIDVFEMQVNKNKRIRPTQIRFFFIVCHKLFEGHV